MDLFTMDEPVQADLRPGEPGFIWESGAVSFDVNQAMLCLENESCMHPYKKSFGAALAKLAKQYSGVVVSGAKDIAELEKLWNSMVDTWVQESGYDEEGNPKATEDPDKALELLIANGNRLELPQDVRFSTACYAQVKVLMQRACGKYSKNGFTFRAGADAAQIQAKLVAGKELNMKKEFQFFKTPTTVIALVHSMVDVAAAKLILEPEAGHGDMVDNLPRDRVHCCELNDDNREVLTNKGYKLVGTDFLAYIPECRYDLILANPPFTKDQDIIHVRHMYDLLKTDGELATVMSTSWRTGNTKRKKEFREWLKTLDHKLVDVPAGAFKTSGTNVSTCVLKVKK